MKIVPREILNAIKECYLETAAKTAPTLNKNHKILYSVNNFGFRYVVGCFYEAFYTGEKHQIEVGRLIEALKKETRELEKKFEVTLKGGVNIDFENHDPDYFIHKQFIHHKDIGYILHKGRWTFRYGKKFDFSLPQELSNEWKNISIRQKKLLEINRILEEISVYNKDGLLTLEDKIKSIETLINGVIPKNFENDCKEYQNKVLRFLDIPTDAPDDYSNNIQASVIVFRNFLFI